MQLFLLTDHENDEGSFTLRERKHEEMIHQKKGFTEILKLHIKMSSLLRSLFLGVNEPFILSQGEYETLSFSGKIARAPSH